MLASKLIFTFTCLVLVITATTNIQSLIEVSTTKILINDKTSKIGSFKLRMNSSFPWDSYNRILVSLEAPMLLFDKCSFLFHKVNASNFQTIRVTGSNFFSNLSEISGTDIEIPIKIRVLSDGSCLNVTGNAVTVKRTLIPSALCRIWGDPHYNDFNEQEYTNMGVGDFILAQTPNIMIQSRQVAIKQYPVVSIMNGLAFKYLNSCTYVMARNENKKLGVTKLSSGSDSDLLKIFISPDKMSAQIYFSDGTSIKVIAYSGGQHLTVHVQIPGSHFNTTRGLCGNYNGIKIPKIEAYYNDNADNLFKITKIGNNIFESGRNAIVPTVSGWVSYNGNGLFGECMLPFFLSKSTNVYCPLKSSTTTSIISSSRSSSTFASTTSVGTIEKTTSTASVTTKSTTSVNSVKSESTTVDATTKTSSMETTTTTNPYYYSSVAMPAPQFKAASVSDFNLVASSDDMKGESNVSTTGNLEITNPANLTEAVAMKVCQSVINSTLCQRLTNEQDKFINTCVKDILGTGSLDFLEEHRISFMAACSLRAGTAQDILPLVSGNSGSTIVSFELLLLAKEAESLHGFGPANCPASCSGRGRCEESGCVCKSGFTGMDCSISVENLATSVGESREDSVFVTSSASENYTFVMFFSLVLSIIIHVFIV